MSRPRSDTCAKGHPFKMQASGRQWCPTCKAEWKRSRRERRAITPIMERLWVRVDVGGPDECWPWLGSIRPGIYGGYGQISQGRGRSPVLTHRLAYESINGPIPDGFEIDHTCHNGSGCRGVGPDCPHRRCCNPAHLEAVTHAMNMRRGNKRVARDN